MTYVPEWEPVSPLLPPCFGVGLGPGSETGLFSPPPPGFGVELGPGLGTGLSSFPPTRASAWGLGPGFGTGLSSFAPTCVGVGRLGAGLGTGLSSSPPAFRREARSRIGNWLLLIHPPVSAWGSIPD